MVEKKDSDMDRKIAVVLFIPVLHKGYIELFKKYRNSDLYIFGQDFVAQHKSLTRDLRIIDEDIMVVLLRSLRLFKRVDILRHDIGYLKNYSKIIMPREDICIEFAEKMGISSKVVYEKVFLRWDKILTETEKIVDPDREVSEKDEEVRFMMEAFTQADKSYDFWRQIGAIIVNKGKIILESHNRHLPSDYSYLSFGDPRSNFDAGQRPDIYTSIHGEADLIAQAARKGVSLEGASIFVTTFPCANCARLIGESGIHKVYYSKGYSRLDAESVLKTYGIKLILVKMD